MILYLLSSRSTWQRENHRERKMIYMIMFVFLDEYCVDVSKGRLFILYEWDKTRGEKELTQSSRYSAFVCITHLLYERLRLCFFYSSNKNSNLYYCSIDWEYIFCWCCLSNCKHTHIDYLHIQTHTNSYEKKRKENPYITRLWV